MPLTLWNISSNSRSVVVQTLGGIPWVHYRGPLLEFPDGSVVDNSTYNRTRASVYQVAIARPEKSDYYFYKTNSNSSQMQHLEDQNHNPSEFLSYETYRTEGFSFKTTATFLTTYKPNNIIQNRWYPVDLQYSNSENITSFSPDYIRRDSPFGKASYIYSYTKIGIPPGGYYRGYPAYNPFRDQDWDLFLGPCYQLDAYIDHVRSDSLICVRNGSGWHKYQGHQDQVIRRINCDTYRVRTYIPCSQFSASDSISTITNSIYNKAIRLAKSKRNGGCFNWKLWYRRLSSCSSFSDSGWQLYTDADSFAPSYIWGQGDGWLPGNAHQNRQQAVYCWLAFFNRPSRYIWMGYQSSDSFFPPGHYSTACYGYTESSYRSFFYSFNDISNQYWRNTSSYINVPPPCRYKQINKTQFVVLRYASNKLRAEKEYPQRQYGSLSSFTLQDSWSLYGLSHLDRVYSQGTSIYVTWPENKPAPQKLQELLGSQYKLPQVFQDPRNIKATIQQLSDSSCSAGTCIVFQKILFQYYAPDCASQMLNACLPLGIGYVSQPQLLQRGIQTRKWQSITPQRVFNDPRAPSSGIVFSYYGSIDLQLVYDYKEAACLPQPDTVSVWQFVLHHSDNPYIYNDRGEGCGPGNVSYGIRLLGDSSGIPDQQQTTYSIPVIHFNVDVSYTSEQLAQMQAQQRYESNSTGGIYKDFSTAYSAFLRMRYLYGLLDKKVYGYFHLTGTFKRQQSIGGNYDQPIVISIDATFDDQMQYVGFYNCYILSTIKASGKVSFENCNINGVWAVSRSAYPRVQDSQILSYVGPQLTNCIVKSFSWSDYGGWGEDDIVDYAGYSNVQSAKEMRINGSYVFGGTVNIEGGDEGISSGGSYIKNVSVTVDSTFPDFVHNQAPGPSGFWHTVAWYARRNILISCSAEADGEYGGIYIGTVVDGVFIWGYYGPDRTNEECGKRYNKCVTQLDERSFLDRRGINTWQGFNAAFAQENIVQDCTGTPFNYKWGVECVPRQSGPECAWWWSAEDPAPQPPY